MTNIVRNVVNSMTDAERLQLIADHKAFERDGFVGACLLRDTAERVADVFGGSAGYAPMWMEQVATAAYRNFAERYIKEMDDGK